MISQYQINNDLVDTTNTPYPSMYMQNNQNGQNQSGNSNSPQDPSTTQSPWDEATNQSFLSNNSYLSFRQQIPPSRTQLPSGPNSYHSQFSGSSQTQQKFANYIAQQNYYYQNQNSNPSPIAQIVTYPQQLSSIQQQYILLLHLIKNTQLCIPLQVLMLIIPYQFNNKICHLIKCYITIKI
jgi:hypothetical protein